MAAVSILVPLLHIIIAKIVAIAVQINTAVAAAYRGHVTLQLLPVLLAMETVITMKK